MCFLVNWLYPPYPPSRQLDPKFCLLGRGPTESRPLVTAFFVFLRASWNLPRHQSFLWSILPRKNCENRGFGRSETVPKPIPKRPKIDVQKTCGFLLFLERCSFKLQSFETLKISIFPEENHYFSGFSKNAFSQFGQFFASKKSCKKP